MKNKKLLIACIGGVCLCVGVMAYFVYDASQIDEARYYRVVRLIDGDTIDVKVGWRTVTVRMLGIDTPETVDPRKPEQCYGREASDEVKKLLAGRKVRLEFNPNRERLDKYRRYLAYVYRDDGLFVNTFLLENGYAREYTFGKAYSKQQEFRMLEKSAHKDKAGLWGACEDYQARKSNQL